MNLSPNFQLSEVIHKSDHKLLLQVTDTLLTIFLFVTLFFPGVQKLLSMKMLSTYIASLLSWKLILARILISILCITEITLAFLAAFSVSPLLVGTLITILFISFLAYRVFLIKRFFGNASCGCAGQAETSSLEASYGGVAGVGIMVGTSVCWTFISA